MLFNPFQKNIVVLQYLIFGLMTVIFLLVISDYQQSYSHLEHSPRYNGGGTSIGNYYIYQAMEPEYAKPNETVNIHFSIQNRAGKDIQNITSMVEIYSQKTGERVQVFPWTKRDTGDFGVNFSFPKIGNYQVVVSIMKYNSTSNFDLNYDSLNSRSLLYSNTNCDCERAVFNISISNSFGIIYTTTVLMGALISLSILGIVLFSKFKSNKKRDANQNTIKYIISILAIAAGLVHLVVNPEHSSLRIEYSIFLLVAAVFQIVYGLLYLISVSTKDIPDVKIKGKIYNRNSNTFLINVFGLIGTIILIGLYFYTLILPPPLSPNNEPEEINLAGVLVQISEIALVIGIIYIIRLEHRQGKFEDNTLLHK